MKVKQPIKTKTMKEKHGNKAWLNFLLTGQFDEEVANKIIIEKRKKKWD